MSKMSSTITNQQQFAHVEKPQIQRSTFDRSSGYKTTLNAGLLYPIYCDEALPGDTINLKAQLFGRLSTPLKPIMDNIFVDLHFFSVPVRLVWENWEKFNGAQDNPTDSTNFTIPTIFNQADVFAAGTIFDYFGLPTDAPMTTSNINVLPFRCYNLIYNEWYRDENINVSLPVLTDNGPDNRSNYGLAYRNKRKDYFTSALPWAQKHDPVTIPLGTTAPVISNNSNILLQSSATPSDRNLALVAGGSLSWSGAAITTGNARFGSVTGLTTDLSSATAVTVNALREAFQVQRMYERDARGGTRYTEVLKSHFGVTSPDARLQRPEFLGGGSAPINITPITQTSATVDDSTPQANLAAMGTFSINNNGFVKSFTEHEYVIGIISIRADLTYQQGLNRMWTRSTRFDFYWPTLAHLGEQTIMSKEIYFDGTANDQLVFGYQERFAEYRYKPSVVTGLYRSNAPTSLDVWHLAQDFETRPVLGSEFLKETPPISRIVAVPSEPEFLLDCYFNQIHARPMPTFATPGLIDHF